MLRKIKYFCVLICFVAASATAQNDDLYVVKDIAVDRSAQTVIEAQTLAFEDARIAASKIIIERLTLESDRKRNREVNIDPRLAERLVAAVDVENEVRGGGRYRGTLSVIFNPPTVRNYLESRGIPFVDTQAPRTLLIPTFKPIELPPIASYAVQPVIKKKIDPIDYVIIPWSVPAVSSAFEGFFPDLDQNLPYVVVTCVPEKNMFEGCGDIGSEEERRDYLRSSQNQTTATQVSGFDDTYGLVQDSTGLQSTENNSQNEELVSVLSTPKENFIVPFGALVDPRLKIIDDLAESGIFQERDLEAENSIDVNAQVGGFEDNTEKSAFEPESPVAVQWPSWEELGYVFEPHPEEVWRDAWPETINEVLSPLSKARQTGYSQYSRWNDLLPEIFAFKAQWAVIAQLDGEEGAYSVTLTRITSDSRDLIGVLENISTHEDAVTAVSKHLDKVWQLEFYAESQSQSSRIANVRYQSISEWDAIRKAVKESQLVKDFQIVSLGRDGALIQFTYSGDSDGLANDMTQNGVSLEIDGRAWIIRSDEDRLR